MVLLCSCSLNAVHNPVNYVSMAVLPHTKYHSVTPELVWSTNHTSSMSLA